MVVTEKRVLLEEFYFQICGQARYAVFNSKTLARCKYAVFLRSLYQCLHGEKMFDFGEIVLCELRWNRCPGITGLNLSSKPTICVM